MYWKPFLLSGMRWRLPWLELGGSRITDTGLWRHLPQGKTLFHLLIVRARLELRVSCVCKKLPLCFCSLLKWAIDGKSLAWPPNKSAPSKTWMPSSRFSTFQTQRLYPSMYFHLLSPVTHLRYEIPFLPGCIADIAMIPSCSNLAGYGSSFAWWDHRRSGYHQLG